MPKLVGPVIEAGVFGHTVQPEIALDSDVILRPWELEDSDAVIGAFSDPDIQRWHVRRVDSSTEAQAWIADSHEAWVSQTGAWWAIAVGADRVVVGRVAIYLKSEFGHAEVSYWVLPEARGRGLATRSCVAATRWAHEVGVHRVELEHSVRNEPSRRVALASGFTEEGIRRGGLLHVDGWHDAIVYSHLATDD